MTEVIKSDDDFNDIDLEVDDNLQNFINYVKNKESEKIPEPTPYVISTQSGWCKFKDMNNINLSKVVSIIAKRMGIAVFHMEAGNRCFDDRVPEEVNRRIIDHSSTILLPYTRNSRDNLLREGIEINRIYVIGNPIYEVILQHSDGIANSKIFGKFKVLPGEYFLVTMHREENVDIKDRLSSILTGLDQTQRKYNLPVVCSLHPRTKGKMQEFDLQINNNKIVFTKPLGFLDFIALEKNAFCVISDSGTVQEECCIFGVPTVTIRDVTERQETIECGSNMITGINPQAIVNSVNVVLEEPNEWNQPVEYTDERVSSNIIKILLGYNPCLPVV